MMNFTRFSFISLAVIGSIFLAACNESQESKTSTDNAAPTAKAPNTKIKAKVRKVLGETDLKRKDSDQWSRLRYGQTVAEYDRIRTAVESEAVMSVNDGTSLWIAELSDVTLDVEIFDSLRHEVAVNVNKGGVFFDVQKQDGRTIKFNTGVATAAIRGTAGFIYSRDGQMVASLKEGLVDVSSNKGATGNVAENQTLIVGQDGVIKNLKLKSQNRNREQICPRTICLPFHTVSIKVISRTAIRMAAENLPTQRRVRSINLTAKHARQK